MIILGKMKEQRYENPNKLWFNFLLNEQSKPFENFWELRIHKCYFYYSLF